MPHLAREFLGDLFLCVQLVARLGIPFKKSTCVSEYLTIGNPTVCGGWAKEKSGRGAEPVFTTIAGWWAPTIIKKTVAGLGVSLTQF